MQNVKCQPFADRSLYLVPLAKIITVGVFWQEADHAR